MLIFPNRNNSDDVAVLRRELHNVQKLMMTDLPEPDFHSNILDENETLRLEIRQLRESSAKLQSEEIEKLRLQLDRMKTESVEAESGQVSKLRQELSEVKASAAAAESESVRNLKSRLEADATEISELKSQLRSAEAKASEFELKWSKVKNLTQSS